MIIFKKKQLKYITYKGKMFIFDILLNVKKPD